MNREKQGKKSFDQAKYLQTMAQMDDFITARPSPKPLTQENPPQSESNKSKPTPRAVQLSAFEENFLQVISINNRKTVGITAETHEKLSDVVNVLGSKGRSGVTVQTYVECILRHHIVQYTDEVNRLAQQKIKKLW